MFVWLLWTILFFHMIYTQNNAINFLIKSCVANSIFQCFFFSFRQNVNNVKIVQFINKAIKHCVFFSLKFRNGSNSKKRSVFVHALRFFDFVTPFSYSICKKDAWRYHWLMQKCCQWKALQRFPPMIYCNWNIQYQTFIRKKYFTVQFWFK